MNFLRLQGNGTSESNRRKTTENISVLVDKNTYYIVYYRLLRYQQAAVAQVVAHLIGSEEVTGPSPVSSSTSRMSQIQEFSRKLGICGIYFCANLPLCR